MKENVTLTQALIDLIWVRLISSSSSSLINVLCLLLCLIKPRFNFLLRNSEAHSSRTSHPSFLCLCLLLFFSSSVSKFLVNLIVAASSWRTTSFDLIESGSFIKYKADLQYSFFVSFL
jgi:hypothetical protein